MKVKLLFILLVGLQTKLNAQVVHDYKQGCCKLVGAINSIESCYCAGCADTAKKNKEAKDAEDKRVKELSIKKAEEQRQAAIEKQKKENEAVAQKNKDAKANTLHYGVVSSDKKEVKLQELKDAKETAQVMKNRTLSSSSKISFVKKGRYLDSWENISPIDEDRYGELYFYEISIDGNITNPKFYAANIIDLGRGTILSTIKESDPLYKKPYTSKVYLYSISGAIVGQDEKIDLQYFQSLNLYGGNSLPDYILPHGKSYIKNNTETVFKKISELIKARTKEGSDVLVVIGVDRANVKDSDWRYNPKLQSNYKNYYYFDLNDKSWKTLIEFPTEQDWNNYFNN